MSFMYFKRSYSLIKNIRERIPRSFTQWSNLVVTFNYKEPKVSKETRFAGDNDQGKFGIFEYEQLGNVYGLLGMKEKAIEKHGLLLNECLDLNRKRKLVNVMDDLSDKLCQVADLSECIRSLHSNTNMVYSSQEVCVELGNVIERLNTNRDLYDKVKQVSLNGDKFPMTDVEKRVIDLFAFDFELCGIHLDEKSREKVVMLNNAILQYGHKFKTKAENPRLIHKHDASPSLGQFFNTTNDDNLIVTGYANIADEFVREQAFKVTLAKNKDQEMLLDNILNYRQQLAHLCGFKTYAHRAIKGGVAEDPDFVKDYLDKLNDGLKKYVNIDVMLMEGVKLADSKRPLALWDIRYMISKIQRESLTFEIDKFLPYFSLGACMHGINLLTKKLFGITLEAEYIEEAYSWSVNCFKIDVIHESEGLLGHIFCDFFEDEGRKPAQDCHFTIKGGRRLANGDYQNPKVVVSLNLPLPTGNAPSLLTPDMAENLFHEMGHALHTMLGRCEFQHVTGTRCATDFAEVPSILMEYFFNDKRVLKSFAIHYKTGEPIPDELITTLLNSKGICTATELQTQLFYSALDQALHTTPFKSDQTTDILRETQTKYYILPYVENTAWHLRFSHLVGYGAKYYSYLMSRSVACNIWQQNFKDDPFNRQAGEKYRHECLAHGGAKNPRLLIKDYLGFDTSTDKMAESIINDIASKYENID